MMPDTFNFTNLSDTDLISEIVEMERRRYALQMEAGKRGPDFCQRLDGALAKYFHVGRTGKVAAVPFDLAGFE
jgi:hypothetical protein